MEGLKRKDPPYGSFLCGSSRSRRDRNTSVFQQRELESGKNWYNFIWQKQALLMQ